MVSGGIMNKHISTSLIAISFFAAGLCLVVFLVPRVQIYMDLLTDDGAIVQGDYSRYFDSTSENTPILVTSPTCVYCDHAMEWLNSNGVTYENISINKDQRGVEILHDLGLDVVPVLVTNKMIIVGFHSKIYRAKLR
jgi:glutaredoxin